jgi:hypothetical protein
VSRPQDTEDSTSGLSGNIRLLSHAENVNYNNCLIKKTTTKYKGLVYGSSDRVPA